MSRLLCVSPPNLFGLNYLTSIIKHRSSHLSSYHDFIFEHYIRLLDAAKFINNNVQKIKHYSYTKVYPPVLRDNQKALTSELFSMQVD